MSTTLRSRGGVAPRPRQFYLDAGHEYVRRYGSDMTAACFNPGSAKRGGRPDLVDRYYAGREDGSAWPSLNSIKQSFGGFVAFREALGLPPNPTGGTSRRAPGEAEPIFTVRERRVVVPSDQTVWITRQLQSAQRRALRAEERLEAAKAEVEDAKSRVSEASPEQERLVNALRNRLADEKSRRKDLKRELHNAVRREDRARARAEIVAAGENPATLREVDRLTDLLADAEERIRALESASPGTKVVVQKADPVVRTRTVTRTKTVVDEKSLRRAERAEHRLAEAREELGAVRSVRDDLADRLATIRREAVAEALKDQRVQTAERRVADLEKQLTEQTELLVGERRMLTEAELESLRRDGPAGDMLFKRAVVKVARAQASGARETKRSALYETMVAAKNWMDRL